MPSSRFRELFSYIGNKMEADLDLIVPVLIKKAGESNGFICDEANKALSAMVHNVSESRAIAALLSSASHRNPAARAKAAAHLAKALELMGYARLLHVRRFTTHTTSTPFTPRSSPLSSPLFVPAQSRELERVLPALPTLLSEGLSETRANAKQIIFGLTREARTNRQSTKGSSAYFARISPSPRIGRFVSRSISQTSVRTRVRTSSLAGSR